MDDSRLQAGRLSNGIQSLVMLGGMAGLAGVLGWMLFGLGGLIVFALLMAVVLPAIGRSSPEWVMRIYRARPVPETAAPELYRINRELARRAGLQYSPDLYHVPSRMLNAFAVGSPERAAIGLTAGLLSHMSGREIAAILAHEIAHVASRDLFVMGLADLVSRTTLTMSQVGQILLLLWLPTLWLQGVSIPLLPILLLIVAPGLSVLLQLGLSRLREYDADLGAVALTGDPQAMASALDKLERLQGGWLERIFLDRRHQTSPLLRTHPPTEERIRRLMEFSPEREAIELSPSLDLSTGSFRSPSRRRLGGFWY